MKVYITGADGFVGRHVVKAVIQAGHTVLSAPHDLVDLTIDHEVVDFMLKEKPDAVIHLAALVGGIGANQARPADFWRDNLVMGVNVIEACRLAEVKRLVMTGTTCSYPKNTPTPFIEERLFSGYPEETNAPYGIAKLALLEGAKAYRRQYGLKSILLVPTNMYGPGDNFNPESSHVIPAMILKFYEAIEKNKSEVVLWGDGTPTRDFLYAPDCAQAFVAALTCPDYNEPINVGSGEEVPISTIAHVIREVVGYYGAVEWDVKKPNGQPRRCLDTSRARAKLKWCSTTPLLQGIRETYQWFKSTR